MDLLIYLLQLVNAVKRTMQAQPKSPRISVEDYGKLLGKQANGIVEKIKAELLSKGINPMEAKTITARDAKVIVDTMQKYINLPGRNKSDAALIKTNVAELMSKVEAEGREARNVDL